MNRIFEALEHQTIFDRVIKTHERALIRATSLLALGDVLAKVLAFAFYVMLARIVTPAEYGLFRFGLTLGYLGSVLAGAFSLTLTHYLASQSQAKEKQSLGAILFLSLVGSISGLMVSLAAFSNGPIVVIGSVFIIIGLSFSYTYQGINRGTQDFGKAAAYPAISNLVQLVPVIVSAFWFPESVLFVAMASYGLSYFVTFFLFEWIKPVPVRITLRGWKEPALRSALRFSTPMILSQGAYQALFGIDLIWLQRFASSEIVGYYAAAKALATAYIVIPNALYGVLMPKTAADTTGVKRHHNLKLALCITAITHGFLITLFALTGSLLLRHLFGTGYERAGLALFVLGIGMLFYALYLVMTANATGLGEPNVQGTGMILGMVATTIAGPFLVVRYSLLGASMSFAFGTFVAFMVALFWSLRPAKARFNE
jgi:O-antigen/teichoic acid export membrane protein